MRRPPALELSVSTQRTRMGPPEYMFFLGLNWVFVATLVGVLTAEVKSGITGFRYRLVGFAIIALSGFLSAAEGKWRELPAWVRAWSLIYSMVTVLMFMRGAFAHPPDNIIIALLIPYILLVLVFLSPSKAFWKTASRVFAYHCAIGTLAVLAVFSLRGGLAMGRDIWDSEIGTSLDLLYSWPFLILTWDRQHMLRRVAGFMAVIVYVGFGVMSQTRSLVFSAVFYVAAYYFFGRAVRARSFLKRYTLPILIGLSGVLAYTVISANTRSDLMVNLGGLMDRTASVWTDQTYFAEKEGRTMEIAILSSRMSVSDWLFGHGLGASWSDSSIYDGDQRFMVHVGYFMLIFSGGLLNLMLFGLGPLLSGVRLLRRRRDSAIAFVCCAVLFERHVRMLYYGAPEASLDFVLLCICFAYAARHVRSTPTRADGKSRTLRKLPLKPTTRVPA